MARPTKEDAAFSRYLAEERRRYIDSLRRDWRTCPATQHLHSDHQKVCPDCIGKVCERMQAKGLDDKGTPLPPTMRPTCNAKTRSGGTCAHKVIPGKIRCRFHGGKSTGPRTPEGRSRIAEAQRKRWAKHRESCDED